MSLSNLCLCYEGIQRIYRNALVSHIRSSLKVAHPNDYLEKLVMPFRKEWEKVKASALERRRTGEISAQVVDEFDLLGVNHFFNLFDVYYDQLLLYTSDFDKEQKTKEKQALLGWLRTVKSLRDPLSHPSDEDLCFEDAFTLLDCARRALKRLDLEDDASRLRELMDKLSGRPLSLQPTVEPLEDKLPPRESILVDFVGRQAELKQLWNWFEDPLSRRWALAGEGGKGKSALAFQFGTEVKFRAPEPFHIVLWLSAKKRRFQEGSVVAVDRPDFFDLDTALSCLLSQYGWIEEATYPVESKRARVLELFDAFPALVIVDDIDSLEGKDEDAIEFFTLNAPQSKSRILLTSRRILFGLGNTTTHVGGFTDADAEKFIHSRFRLMELDSKLLTPSIIREIIRVTEGSPLYIEDLLRFIALLPAQEAIRVWSEKGGSEARKFAIRREFDLLTKDARYVLLAACIAPGPVSFPELEAVTELSGDQLTAALNELQRLFLVPKPRLIEGEQRFDTNINTRSLVMEVLGGDDLYRRMETAYRAVSGKIPKGGRRDVAAIVRQAVFHVRNRDYNKAEELLIAALEKYTNDPDLIGILGWVYKAWEPISRITDARERFKRAWQLKSSNEAMYTHWSRMELGEREWTKATQAAESGMKQVGEGRLLLYFAGYARGRLARELLAGLHTDRAQEEAIKSQDLLERALKAPELLEAGERRLNADIYRALVLNCELLRDPNGMTDYFERWLGEHPKDPDARSEWDRLSKRFNLSTSAG